MKVIPVNGSSHRNGCTYTTLQAVGEALTESGISCDNFWIGNRVITGCIACKSCIKHR